MKPSLISLRCDHCGAPIEVRRKAKFVTCSYCTASLAVHHTGSSYSTEVLEELQETTNALVKDVAQIKQNVALQKLDDEWERKRLRLLGTNKNGRQITSPPNAAVTVFFFGLVITFAIFWTVIAFSMAPFMGLGGVFFIVVAVLLLFHSFSKMEEYKRAKRQHQLERSKLIGEIQSGSHSISQSDHVIQ